MSNIVNYKVNTRKTSPLSDLLVSLENTYHVDQNNTIFKFCWVKQKGEVKLSDQRREFNLTPRSLTVIIHGICLLSMDHRVVGQPRRTIDQNALMERFEHLCIMIRHSQ